MRESDQWEYLPPTLDIQRLKRPKTLSRRMLQNLAGKALISLALREPAPPKG
jgi:hypothetical protein